MSREISDAVLAELVTLVGQRPDGAPAIAIHQASVTSADLQETILALKRLRDDGRILFDKGSYFPRTAGDPRARTARRVARLVAGPGAGKARRDGVGLRILRFLSRPMTRDQIVGATQLSTKQVSNHLFFLQRSGLVEGKRTGAVTVQKTWWRTFAGLVALTDPTRPLYARPEARP